VLVERVRLDEQLPGTLPERRGWFVLDGDGGDDPIARIGAAIEALRALGQRPQMPSVIPG
jgi:hypothetical protein